MQFPVFDVGWHNESYFKRNSERLSRGKLQRRTCELLIKEREGELFCVSGIAVMTEGLS